MSLRHLLLIVLSVGLTASAQETLPPEVRLGARAELIRRNVPATPDVVIVHDEPAYVEAIASWSPRSRFPVLLDDGRAGTREDIARFVRAFQPRSVVRWTPDLGRPGNVDARRDRIDTAFVRSWGLGSRSMSLADMVNAMRQRGLTPPGLVFADASDGGRFGALALAAGHAQPIVWIESTTPINGRMDRAEALRLHGLIFESFQATGLNWDIVGDDLDAITFCLDMAVRMGDDPILATTDVLGRHPDGETFGARFAWTGHLFGTSAQSAYRAMCALFLQPRSSLLFDGYPNEPPWNEWDVQPAAQVLGANGVEPIVFDDDTGDVTNWRRMISAPLDAGLVMVNSKGNADVFQLGEDLAHAGDVPTLRVPAFVYFVHSWSASRPESRLTVAGRFLERGAFAYAGSVHEPFLQAFIPTPAVAKRLLSTAAWGAAVRHTSDEPWKITVLGDPLLTLGPPTQRVQTPPPLEGLASLDDVLRDALEREDFDDAMDLLVVLGRDADAVRLAQGLLRERAEALTPQVADPLLFAAFREHDPTLVFESFTRLGAKIQPMHEDLLWHACADMLRTSEDTHIVEVMRRHVRSDVVVRDASEVARALVRHRGRRAALAFLEQTLAGLTERRDIRQMNRVIREYR